METVPNLTKQGLAEYLGRCTSAEFPGELWAAMPDNCNREIAFKYWQDIAISLSEYDADKWEDYLHEIADSAIPVYYSGKWQEVNDMGLAFCDDLVDESMELIGGSIDKDNPLFDVLNAYLFTFYYRAADSLAQYIKDNATVESEE